MTELQRLKNQLDNLLIENELICERTLALGTKPVFINNCGDGLYIYGWGFSGLWPYSAEFVARALDRKFREEAVNNQYLLRMGESKRKSLTVCEKKPFKKRKRKIGGNKK